MPMLGSGVREVRVARTYHRKRFVVGEEKVL